MSSTQAGQVSDPGKAWGRWEKVARPEQGPGARRTTPAPHNQHDPPPTPDILPHPSWPCPSPGAWHPRPTAALPAGLLGVHLSPRDATPGRKERCGRPRPAARHPEATGSWGQAGCFPPSPPLLLSWDRAPMVEEDLASHRRVGGAENERWGFRGSGELSGLQMREALGALVSWGGRGGQGLTLVTGRWHLG